MQPENEYIKSVQKDLFKKFAHDRFESLSPADQQAVLANPELLYSIVPDKQSVSALSVANTVLPGFVKRVVGLPKPSMKGRIDLNAANRRMAQEVIDMGIHIPPEFLKSLYRNDSAGSPQQEKPQTLKEKYKDIPQEYWQDYEAPSVQNFGLTALDSLMFGLVPAAVGLVSKDAKKKLAARLDAYNEANKWKSTGAKVLGGLGGVFTGGAALKGAGYALKGVKALQGGTNALRAVKLANVAGEAGEAAKAVKAAGILARAGKAAGTGAGYGAAYGVGEGLSRDKSAEEIMHDAATGALYGAGLGAGGEVAITAAKGGTNALRAMMPNLFKKARAREAFERIGKSHIDESLNKNQALVEGQSPTLARVTEDVIHSDSKAGDYLKNLQQTAEGEQLGKVTAAAEKLFGKQGETAFEKMRHERYDPKIEEAYRKAVETGEISLNNPNYVAELKTAQTNLQNKINSLAKDLESNEYSQYGNEAATTIRKGLESDLKTAQKDLLDVDTKLYNEDILTDQHVKDALKHVNKYHSKLTNLPNESLKKLDEVKKQLDSKIKIENNASRKREMKASRSALIAKMEEASPLYKDARDAHIIWKVKVENAIKAGKNLNKLSPQELAETKALISKDPLYKEAFNAGMYDNMMEVINAVKPTGGNLAGKVNPDNLVRKLEDLGYNYDEMKRLQNMMHNILTPTAGSQTAARQAFHSVKGFTTRIIKSILKEFMKDDGEFGIKMIKAFNDPETLREMLKWSQSGVIHKGTEALRKVGVNRKNILASTGSLASEKYEDDTNL